MPGRKPEGAGRDNPDKHGPSDLFDYVVAYAKQETLDPVVRQAKALGRGIAGALLLAIGTVLLAIGFLRALQGEFGSNAGTATASPTSLANSTAAPAAARASTKALAASTSVSHGVTTTVAPTSVSGAGSTTAATASRLSSFSAHAASTSLVASTPAPNPYGSGHPLSGDWSWVPYMGGALLCLLVAAFCVTRIVRGSGR